jgi:ABC-type transport system involved in multi-copper enzyme maturation permease subunit
MNNLIKIKYIAMYTFKEIYKSKILLNTLLLGLGLLFVTYIAYSFTYGTPSRIALDFGLGMLSLSSVGIAIFIGVGLLSKEIESRTVYMIISRPVPRYVFILGKIIGLIGILILNILILSALTLLLYFVIGGTYTSLIHWCVIFTILEACLVLFLVSFLSLISSPTLTVIISLMIYISGHTISSAKSTLFAKNVPGLMDVLDIYHFILPGFYKLNIKDFLLYKQDLSTSYLFN